LTAIHPNITNTIFEIVFFIILCAPVAASGNLIRRALPAPRQNQPPFVLEHRHASWKVIFVDTPGPVDQEQIIWTAHPSQITNFGLYTGCLAAIGAIVAAFFLIPEPRHPYVTICLGVLLALAVIVFLTRWMLTRSRTYQVTSERIKIIDGVLNRRTEELELYRVRDYKLTEPFWLRLFGLGNIIISSTDNSNPTVVFHAIHDPNGRREELRKYVETCRDKKRVRITEMES